DIGPGVEEFCTEDQVQGQIVSGFPIVLSKESEIVLTVFVIEDAAAAEAEVGCANQKALPVGKSIGSAASVQIVDEEELSVEDLRKELVEIDEVNFATEANDVRAADPGDSIEERVVVLFVG